jgi:hypothetical protein
MLDFVSALTLNILIKENQQKIFNHLHDCIIFHLITK